MSTPAEPQRLPSAAEAMYERRLHDATRAIKTGVHWRNGFVRDTEVGVRSQIICDVADLSALVTLLVEKGVITREEYLRKMAEAREAHARQLQEWIAQQNGRDVNLYEF